MATYQQYINIPFKEFAERILQTESSQSIDAYALNSLLGVMRKVNVEDIDEKILKLWVVTMVMDDKKVSTCKRYFGKVHSLYNEWSGNSEKEMFTEISPLFMSLNEVDTNEPRANLNLVNQLLNKAEQSEDWQTVCIFFYLLYNPLASMADVANLTFANVPYYCPQIDDIINSFDSSHGRKYVFKLKQGKSRPNEIIQKVSKDLLRMLRSMGMRFENGFSRSSITSLWITAALKCNIDLQEIRSCIGIVPQEYSALSVLDKINITESRKETIISAVAGSINDCAARWFVMKLRRGISFDDIKNCIENKFPGHLNAITLFYPTKTEIHKEGRRRIVEETPYLPNILFFKTQTNKVKGLFANIGDLAWCFKTSDSIDSDYAAIPNRQMTNFQQCIGRFTPDIKMELICDAQPLEIGRKVKVIGGIMAGYEGEIIDVEGEAGKRVFFLSIADNMRARWTAHVEDVFIQPIV